MDGMGCQVPEGHKGKGEILEQQVLRSPWPTRTKGRFWRPSGSPWTTRTKGRFWRPSGFPWATRTKGGGWCNRPSGPPGPRSGGVVYTRWGKTSCPNVSGTQLVYAGRAGGTYYNNKGGTANCPCMPDDPDYLRYQTVVQGYSYVYEMEYEVYSGQPPSCFQPQCSLCCVLCFNEGSSHNDPS